MGEGSPSTVNGWRVFNVDIFMKENVHLVADGVEAINQTGNNNRAINNKLVLGFFFLKYFSRK